jgi:hypothetical protein
MDVSPERKAKVEMLDQMSEFDPINDYDSNYGRVLGVKVPLPSPTLGGGRGLLQPLHVVSPCLLARSDGV